VADKLVRSDFVIKDLVVSLPSPHAGGGGGTWMPAEDGEPLPWWISPVAGVLVKGRVLETVTATIKDAVKQGGDFADIGLAFREGAAEGNAVIRRAIHNVGSAVVAAAAYAAVGGSDVALPDPDCGGSSLETVPPTLTPVILEGGEIHRVTDLPRLRKQLAIAVEALDRAAVAHAPRGDEVKLVARHLEEALGELREPRRSQV
jgi:hypothetical protein